MISSIDLNSAFLYPIISVLHPYLQDVTAVPASVASFDLILPGRY